MCVPNKTTFLRTPPDDDRLLFDWLRLPFNFFGQKRAILTVT